jgi:glycosyltransferase involved in cell wall biosynthesis
VNARPLKLAVVASSYSTYISTNHVLIAQGLVERGNRVVLVSTAASNVRLAAYGAAGPDGAGALPFPVVHVPYLTVVRDNVVTFPRLAEVPDDLDAVLLQEDYPLLSIEMARWADRRGVPVVISCERYGYPKDVLTRGLLRLLDASVLPRIRNLAGAMTFHSHRSLDFYRGLGAPSDRLSFLPAAIDAEDFRRRTARASRRDRTGGPMEILCIARLHPYKGLDTLIAAVAALEEAGVEVRAEIRGRGPLEGALRAQIAREALGDRVRLETGPIPNSEVPNLLANVDVYVQPSRVEPFGSAVVEAMASGLPIIGTAVGGIRDTVVPGVTGLLVPPDDPGCLATAIRSLHDAPTRRSEMGRAAQLRALANFDYRILSADYETLVRGIAQ